MEQELIMLNGFEKDTLWLHSNLDKLRPRFENKFVAIKDKDIIASNERIEEVINQLQKKNINPAQIVIEFVHKKGVQLIL